LLRLLELLRVAEQHEALGAAETASTSASDIWPASSMNNTSTLFRNRSLAQSHDVPPSKR
jgi:hypothetical protein